MVIYFTGTGNSRYIAEKISEAICEPVFCINEAIKNGRKEAVNTGEKVILVVPVYAWRIPRIVSKWLLETKLSGAEKIWFVVNCGSEIGNAAKYNIDIAKKKNLDYMGTIQVKMPENYIALFNTPGEKEAIEIIQKAQPDIEEAIEAVKEGRTFKAPKNNLLYKFMSGPVNSIFYRVIVKADAFRAEENCIGCGKCVKLCPLNNIWMENGKPCWGKTCTHCMTCISYCPFEAIEYGKKSAGKIRYRVPEV